MSNAQSFEVGNNTIQLPLICESEQTNVVAALSDISPTFPMHGIETIRFEVVSW